MNRIFLLILLSLFSAGLYAQTTDGKTVKVWTLRECVDYALANNLNVQRSQYNVESYGVILTQSKMSMIPTLNASLSNGYNWGRSINPVTNEFTTQQIRSLGPNASSTVTLFNTFRIQNQIKQSTKDLQASEADLLKSKNDVSLTVVNYYINVIFNKELLDNARLQLSSSQQQFERTKKQVAAGALPKSDELSLDAQVATNEVNVVNAENSLNFTTLQLKQALLLPASEPMDVEVPILNVEDLVIDQTSEQIFDIARQAMPETKSAELKVKSSYYGTKVAKASLFPRITLNGSISSNYSSANDRNLLVPDGGFTQEVDPSRPAIGVVNVGGTPTPVFAYAYTPTGTYTNGYGYRDQLGDNLFKSLSFSLIIPIFNNYQVRTNVQRSVINQRMAELDAKAVNQTLRQNVETVYNDASAASKSYNSSLRQVNAREEAFRMIKQRYDIGAANFVEYQVAENDLFRAKSDLVRAKYNFIFRKKVLDFYQGKPLGL